MPNERTLKFKKKQRKTNNFLIKFSKQNDDSSLLRIVESFFFKGIAIRCIQQLRLHMNLFVFQFSYEDIQDHRISSEKRSNNVDSTHRVDPSFESISSRHKPHLIFIR